MTVDWSRQNYSGDDPGEHPAVKAIEENFPEAFVEADSFRGEVWVVVKPENCRAVLHYLAEEPSLSFDYLSDLTAVHRPREDEQFEIVYQLYSLSRHSRFRVKTRLQEGREADSVVSVWQGANWFEREVYDYFGVVFSGHPDMRRIMNPEGFVGHPLRKDFPVGGRVKW